MATKTPFSGKVVYIDPGKPSVHYIFDSVDAKTKTGKLRTQKNHILVSNGKKQTSQYIPARKSAPPSLLKTFFAKIKRGVGVLMGGTDL